MVKFAERHQSIPNTPDQAMDPVPLEDPDTNVPLQGGAGEGGHQPIVRPSSLLNPGCNNAVAGVEVGGNQPEKR